MIKKIVQKNWLFLLGAGVGAIAGFIYWHQVGCASGTCMITSKPVNSTIYGAVMGGLLFSLFRKTDLKS
jgi:hypothetical protein